MNLPLKAEKDLFLEHYPVLLDEVLKYLSPKNGCKYLDCTFGAGGYTNAILQNNSNCEVVAIDQDPNVEIFASRIEKKFGNRFRFIRTNFAHASRVLEDQKFDGIVLDLGISSMQVDKASRGFSFMKDGPLDMRMSCDGISAAEFLESASEDEIANIIYKYGNEKGSRAIAHNIIKYRQNDKIDTTLKLAAIVRNSLFYKKGKIDPATKTFQAIRIFINKELESLENFLEASNKLLLSGGKIVVVTFHSLEDSIVKNFFREYAQKKAARSKYSRHPEIFEKGKWLKIITNKPVAPSRDEILLNPRSRSAKLRVAEKMEVAYVS